VLRLRRALPRVLAGRACVPLCACVALTRVRFRRHVFSAQWTPAARARFVDGKARPELLVRPAWSCGRRSALALGSAYASSCAANPRCDADMR
jgi:hypothetical protein